MQVWRNNSGFTVIEILIVTILSSLLMVAVLQSFQIVEQVWQRNTSEGEFKYQVSRCFDYIEADLTTVFFGTGNYPLVGIDGQTETGDDGDTLQFVTADGRLPEINRYDLIRVDYYLGKAAAETPSLVRTVDPLPFVPAEPQTAETTEYAMNEAAFDGSIVRSMNIRYFNGSEWLDSWDSRTAGSLPLLVEVSLGLADPRQSDRIRLITRNFRILSSESSLAGASR